MSEITVKIPTGLKTLDDSLRSLSEKPSFERAQSVVNNVISLLGINSTDAWKPFNDSQGKIRSNAGWFMVAEGFADKRAAYKLADNNAQSVDLKCYWMKKLNKSVISWLVALTPNFEDEPFYGKLNIGVDFVIPEEADRVLVVLSKDYVIRTVELQDQLSVTQQEIFNSWLTDFNFANKSQVHEVLWKSFDLEPVNKSFYNGISSFFVELKQFLAEHEEVYDDKHAAYFTNRLIGRIVFCWFLNKKGIINPEIRYFDIGKLKATEYYRKKLEVLFFKVFSTPIEERDFGVDDKTPFLNGGLFEVKDNDKFGDPNLVFPGDYFDRFFQFLRHYNFTTDESTSTFQQVAIDPEMLGRIFENLLAEQVEETGAQARKAKGAFYTPREIVDYMCRESLREYLKTKISEDEYRDQRISLLLDVKPHEFRDQQRNYRRDFKPYKYDILKALDEIKIIDLTCGSGAFPMGMLHLLLDAYDRLDATFDPYKKKIEIIKDNLFGVDIEPMAVEICRLRVWLSIIVDEEADSKKIEPLPNLDFKFICANSLIPLRDENDKRLFDMVNEDELLEIRDKYFNARTIKSKNNLRKKLEKKIDYRGGGNIFSSEREKQLRTYHPFDSENVTQFLDPDFMFGVQGGFDVVIGNPPYIDSEGMVKHGQKQLREFIAKSYSFTKGNWDIYIAFFELGFNLLSAKGILAYITPDKWISKPFGDQLRISLTKNIFSILQAGRNVFESANVDSIVTLFKRDNVETLKIDVFEDENIRRKNEISKKILKPPFQLDYLFSSHLDLLLKITSMPNVLEEVCVCENACATYDAYKLKPLLKNIDSEIYVNKKYFKVINTGTIDKYLPKWGMREMTYLKDKYLCPVVIKKDFLGLFSKSYGKKACKQKIIIKGLTLLDTCIDDKGEIVPGKSTLVIPYSDEVLIKFVLALLNSQISIFYIKERYVSSSYNGGINFTKDMINALPCKIPDKNTQNKFARIVDEVMRIKKERADSDISEQMKQIDQLVYEIYEITNEERKIIEDGCAK